MRSIEICTDGACGGNPGPGGNGVVRVFDPPGKELSGGFAGTTNNRMEFSGAIAGAGLVRITAAAKNSPKAPGFAADCGTNLLQA